MSEQEKNEQALKQLGIEIPEGWEFVRYGVPLEGEFGVDVMGLPSEVFNDNYETEWLIIKKKIETECWYLVEDKEGDSPCMWLNIHNEWQVYKREDAPTWRFDKFEIISKMVVEK